MKKYLPNDKNWYCGHWNNSPIEIKYSEKTPLKKEEPHFHLDIFEYYFVFNGEIVLEVEKEKVKLSRLELLMIEPREKHRIIEKNKDSSYLIIKDKSIPNNKKF